MNTESQKTSAAFVGASWLALIIGMATYLIGLWNAEMALNEKGYYFIALTFGLFAAVSVQKSVRDKAEGIPITPIYLGLSWLSVLLSVSLMVIGLWNATLLRSEKGFFAMTFVLSLFAAIVMQKNTRDNTEAISEL